jgi:hypothetical protein
VYLKSGFAGSMSCPPRRHELRWKKELGFCSLTRSPVPWKKSMREPLKANSHCGFERAKVRKGLSWSIAAADGLTALLPAMLVVTRPVNAFDGTYGFHEIVTGPFEGVERLLRLPTVRPRDSQKWNSATRDTAEHSLSNSFAAAFADGVLRK